MKILCAELNFQGHEDNTKTNLTSYMIWIRAKSKLFIMIKCDSLNNVKRS